jgi:hypothetical protein
MEKKDKETQTKSQAISVGASRHVGVVDVTDNGEPIYGMTNSSDKSLSVLKKIGGKFHDSGKDEKELESRELLAKQ